MKDIVGGCRFLWFFITFPAKYINRIGSRFSRKNVFLLFFGCAYGCNHRKKAPVKGALHILYNIGWYYAFDRLFSEGQ